MEHQEQQRLVLNAGQKFALCKLMDANREKYNGMVKAAIASDLRPQVDFDFNVSNVEYLAKQIGIEPAKKRISSPHDNDQEKINKMLIEVIDHLAFKMGVNDGTLMNWIYELRKTVFKVEL